MDNFPKRDSVSIYTSEIMKLKQEINALKEKNASLEKKELQYAQRFIRNSMPNLSLTSVNKEGSNDDDIKSNTMMNSSINDLMKKYETKNDDLSSQLIIITDQIKEIIGNKDQIEVLKLEMSQLTQDNQSLRKQLANNKDISLKDKDIDNLKKNNSALEEKLLIITNELEEKKKNIARCQWGYDLKRSKNKSFELKTTKDSINSGDCGIQSSIHKFKNEILIEIRNLIHDKGNEVKLIKQSGVSNTSNTNQSSNGEVLINKINQLTSCISDFNTNKGNYMSYGYNKEKITYTPNQIPLKEIKEESLLIDNKSDLLVSFDDYTLKCSSDISTLFTKGWEFKSNPIYAQKSLEEFSKTEVASIALLSNCESDLMHTFICQLTNYKYDEFLSLSNVHFKYLIEDQPPLLISASILSHYHSLSSLLIDKFLYQSCLLPIFFTNLLSHSNIEYLLRVISNNTEKKELFIIHNLSCFSYLSNIDDYVKNYLMNGLFSPNIKKTFMLSLKNIKMKKNKNYWFYSDCRKNSKINHLIIAKDNSEAGDYYNETTFEFLIKTIHLLSDTSEFIIEDQMHKFIKDKFGSALKNISNESLIENGKKGYIKLNQLFQTKITSTLNSLNELNYYNSLIESFVPDYNFIVLKQKIQIVIEINDLVANLYIDIHPIESIGSDDVNSIYSFEIKGEKLLKYSSMYFLEFQPNESSSLSFSNRRSGKFCLKFEYKIPKQLTYLLSRKGIINYELGMLIICFE